MITASRGSHRFESGPTFHFNGSTFAELSDVIINPVPTVDYVNTLPNVNTTPEEMRQVAASGIARLAIEGPEIPILEQTGKMLVDVVGGGTIDRRQYANPWSGRWDNGKDIFYGRGLQNQILDSASVLATRKNRDEETASILLKAAPTEDGYFVIALANGGLISAARTFRHIGEGDHAFGMVRYSRYKSHDSKPVLSPYADDRERWLRKMADRRRIVVFDEDYTSGKTLKTATEYFSSLLGARALGIAPVEVERRITYNPLVVESE